LVWRSRSPSRTSARVRAGCCEPLGRTPWRRRDRDLDLSTPPHCLHHQRSYRRFAGALFVHELGSISTGQVLHRSHLCHSGDARVGGTGSLWGAVLGGIALGVLETFLSNAENGVAIGSLHVHAAQRTECGDRGRHHGGRAHLRSEGITGSHEFLERFFSTDRQRRAPAPSPRALRRCLTRNHQKFPYRRADIVRRKPRVGPLSVRAFLVSPPDRGDGEPRSHPSGANSGSWVGTTPIW